jgi:hypothetical protein
MKIAKSNMEATASLPLIDIRFILLLLLDKAENCEDIRGESGVSINLTQIHFELTGLLVDFISLYYSPGQDTNS